MPDEKSTPTVAPAEKESVSKHAAKAALEELAKALKRVEETTGRSGAVPRQPKAHMYNIEALKKANPDKHYRYVNVSDDDKAQARIDDGYKAVSEEECEKHGARSEIGTTRLMELPREVAEERRREIDEITRSRLKAPGREVREAAEAVVKEMRDKYGVDVPLSRFLVDEKE